MTPTREKTPRSQGVECPLCHTVETALTVDSVRAGDTWQCERCGQTWSGERLDRLAAYERFAAAHEAPRTGSGGRETEAR